MTRAMMVPWVAAMAMLVLIGSESVLETAAVVVRAQAVPGGLLAAQHTVRGLIRQAPSDDIHVIVEAGVHVLSSPIVMGPEDSGVAGKFRVVWSAAAPNTAVYDGGAQVNGPWRLETQRQRGASVNVWSAALAPDLVTAPVRQLYVDGVRFERTRSNATLLGFPAAVQQTPTGYNLTVATEQLGWDDVSAVELVSDHTWVQHRCPVTRATPLPIPPPPPPTPPGPPATCTWGNVSRGRSPGSSLRQENVADWAACQELCCAMLPGCQAVLFYGPGQACFVLGRKFESNYSADGSGSLADLDCTGGATPRCPAAPPSPVYRTALTISGPCFATATHPGALALTPTTVSFFENTGVFSRVGQFYVNRSDGRLYVASPTAPTNAVLGVTQTLLLATAVHDVEYHNLTFAHSGWGTPTTTGIVERYSGVLTPLSGGVATMSPAAVTVANASRVTFTGCTFTRLGAWGLRLANGSQDVTVTRCTFNDLSGGGVCVGNLHDSLEARPEHQMASVVVDDNTLIDLGQEYKGSTAIHTFCMRQSSISHNIVRGVSYTGLSYNWPDPQGPTFGPPNGDGNGSTGYSRDNVVNGNDVSEYMRYMKDGGGIHTIGRSANTTVSRNFFHDVASGGMCQGVPCHSTVSQASIYIDNWSAGYVIDANVVINTSHLAFGWIFFQYFAGKTSHGQAHDNTAANNTICNAGPVPPQRDPWDEVNGSNVTGTVNVTALAIHTFGGSCLQALPQFAADVVRESGPRF
eukprot:m.171137 g.171137  ORF g.171137 m.171137 type:complete len:748 (-) comp24220_c0_seq1:311-2554(-)